VSFDPGSGMGDALGQMLAFTQLQTQAMPLLLGAHQAKQQGDLELAAERYMALIDVHRQQLELAEAAAQTEGGADFEVPGIAQSWATAAFTLADVRGAQRRADEAQALREEAAHIAATYLGDVGTADAQATLASAFLAEGRINQALTALAQAAGHAHAEGDALKRAQLLKQRADVLQWLGDFERALACIAEARALADAPPEPSGAGTAEGLLSSVMSLLGGGDPEQIQRSVALRQMATELDYYTGLIQRMLGHHDEARAVLERVLPVYEGLGVAAAVRYHECAMFVDEGSLEAGLELAKAIEPALRAPGLMRPKLGALLRVQSEALRGLDRLDEALAHIQEALQDIREYNDPDVRWRVEAEHARVLAARGQTEEALAAFEDATATVDRLRSGSLGYRLDSLFLADKAPLFDEAIGLAAAQGDSARALAWIERVKARSLAVALRSGPGQPRADASETQQRVEVLSRHLDRLEYQAYQDGWTPATETMWRSLSDERSDAIERVRYSDPRWRALSEPPGLDVAALCAHLAARDQCALVLHRLESVVTVIAVDGVGHALATHALSVSTRASLAAYTRTLGNGQQPVDPGAFDPATYEGLAAEDLIPSTLLERALRASSLVVIPHRDLHLLPWAGLAHGGGRLFESLAVSVVPNLTSLVSLDFEPRSSPRVSVFGDPDYSWYPLLEPLPGAAEELADVAHIYGPDRTAHGPQTGAEASQSAFWTLLSDANPGDVLHLACHATVEPQDPTQSGLLLSDAKVDAAELAAARLPFDEVVLSACSTGWRPQAVGGVALLGDDLLGLPGAVLEAGARSVLVSIPPADDAAARDLTVAYHTRRASGAAPQAAFRGAQTELLQQDRHPVGTWIGFTLYGCR